MENVQKKKTGPKKVNVDDINSGSNLEVSLTKLVENEKNVYKYTKHGAIRQSWIRDEARREKAGNNDLIAVRVKEELLRLEAKKAKEDEKERLKQHKKNETIRIREEKKNKIKLEKVDMRGKSEKSIAHGKKMGSKLQESLRKKYLKKEEERQNKYPDSDSGEEEITTTTIRKKRSCSKTPEIDYRRFYEDSIRKKTIKEDEEKVEESRNNNSRSQSPHISHIRNLQRNIFKGIL